MKGRFLKFVVGVVFFTSALYIWELYLPDSADIFLKVLTPVGLLTTVAFTLYGDFLRGWFYPVRIRIEVLSREESNQDIETVYQAGSPIQFYSHHLRVRNLSPKKAVENCRVWLKSVSFVDETRPNRPIEANVFGAPRLMEWAPSEYSPDTRTFITEQIFDIGKTFEDRFEITIHPCQDHAVKTLAGQKDKFATGATFRCVLYVTADNYQDEDEFTFKITAGSTGKTLSKIEQVRTLAQTPMAADFYSMHPD
jgi:hypothetical protein